MATIHISIQLTHLVHLIFNLPLQLPYDFLMFKYLIFFVAAQILHLIIKLIDAFDLLAEIDDLILFLIDLYNKVVVIPQI